mgnify:CR=1 FL=1
MTPETVRSYPKLLYNAAGQTRRVGSLEEEKELGLDWQCNPVGEPYPRPDWAPPEPKHKATGHDLDGPELTKDSKKGK